MTFCGFILALTMIQESANPAVTLPVNLNTAMMEATFRIVGVSRISADRRVTGTGFLVAKSTPDRPGGGYFVLVSAAHVFDDMQGDTAMLVVRLKDPVERYKRFELPLPIRRKGEPVLAIGYPYGFESNDYGFPVLRSGRIASFPLSPSQSVRKFLVDFNVFGGNSGGPVYINQLGRSFGGVNYLDKRIFLVLGVVVDQTTMTSTGERLGVAGVVPAQFVRDTLNLLPPKPPK